MNPLSITLSPSPFFNIMIIAHLFLNAFLIFVVWRLKEKVTEPEEPDCLSAGEILFAKNLTEEIRNRGQSEAKVKPIPEGITSASAIAALRANEREREFFEERVAKGSKEFWEGDIAEEKGGYVDPVIRDGSKGKEYEAYVPANDEKRKMEGKEDRNFI